MSEDSILQAAQRKREYAEYLELTRKGRDCTPEERQRLRELRKLTRVPRSPPLKPQE